MQSLRKFPKRSLQACLAVLLCIALLLPTIGTSFVFEAGAAPVATITFSNPVSASGGIALVGNQGDSQTQLINVGGYAVMEPLQYAYFTVSNASILSASALTMEITFFDNTTSSLNVQYCSTSGAYYSQRIERYSSNELVTTTIALPNADFDAYTQNCGAKFRISGGGAIRSISISLGVTDDSNQAPPSFAPQTNANNLIGKGVAGYQAWFRASNEDSKWVHWGGNGSANPAPGQLSFEIYPSVNEYTENGATLYPSKLGDLGNGEDSLLFNSTDPAIIDTHFKWMQQYDIDGAAVQRFYTTTSTAKTTAKNHLQTIQEKAEKYNRLFYVMYDFSGCASHDATTFLSTVKLDFIYNVENKGVASSTAYAHADGKPVVCFWGISGDPNSGYISGSTATSLIQWFKNRGYYVIVGTPDNSYATRSGDYLRPFTLADMISPWTVGRYSEAGAANWLNNHATQDMNFCNTYGSDYQPVVFAGFGWTNMGNNGGINAFPHNAGQFLWTQAYKLKSLGASNIYFAMFDEYDEGTAIMKGASDYFEIPTDQYFMTYATDGWWLSNDFYLRAAGAVIDMMQGKTALRASIDIPHSQGPVYWRNSFESRSTTYYLDGVQYTGTGKLDVCLNNPALLSTSAVSLSGNAIVTNRAKSGASSFRLNGNSSGNGTAYYKIADTAITTSDSLTLTYSLYAVNTLGREVFVDLLFSDGTYLSNGNSTVTATHGTTGQWSDVTIDIGRAAAGKTITGVIVGYAGGNGSFDAYVDDIALATSSNESSVTLNMTEVSSATAYVDYSNATYANLNKFQFGDNSSSGSTVSINGTTAAKFSQYLYLAVNDSYIGENDADVIVRITYLDNDSGNPIKLQYNSNDPDAFPAQNYTDHLIAGTATGTWRTVEVALDNASFRNAQNAGCDLRIGCNNGGYLYVSRVEIVNNNNANASITFSNATNNSGTGLSLIASGTGDCAYTAATYNNTAVRRIDNYLYVSVSDEEVKTAAHVEVEINYYDLGSTRLYLQYNAASHRYKTESFVTGNTGALVSHTFTLEDAAFTGSQNYGADFRISGANLYIRSIKIRVLDSASALFGSDISGNGMTVVASGTGDCAYTATTADSNSVYKVDNYLYCTISNEAVKNASSVKAIVTYYDNSGGTLYFQYNSSSSRYQTLTTAKGNTGSFNTATFIITDAAFTGSQNYGADFRISGSDIYVKSIVIIPVA